MKKHIFSKLNFLLLLLWVLTAYGCTDRSKSDLLTRAEQIAETDPALSLALLDSVSHPESMPEDAYMHYIVTRTQARAKLKDSFENDTLVFNARRYFERKGNLEMTIMANFYSAGAYYFQKKNDKALYYFLQSEYYAKKAKNDLLLAKSLNNIGVIYFEQDFIDKSLKACLEALNIYDNKLGSNTLNDSYKLQTINTIGENYTEKTMTDSAYFYFNRGLQIAKEIGNKNQESIFLRFMARALKDKKEYKNAIQYLDKSIVKSANTQDSIRTYLMYSIVYNQMNKPDSALYYINIINNPFNFIDDKYTIRGIYKSLLTSNEELGNYKEALIYSEKAKKINEQILHENTAVELAATEQKHAVMMEKEQTAKANMRSFLIGAIAVFSLLVISILSQSRNKQNKLKAQREEEKATRAEAENKLLATRNDFLKDRIKNMSFVQNIYQNILTDWASIDKEVKNLAAQYGTTEEPEIFRKIRDMVDNLKAKSNKQFIERGKELLKQQPSGKKAIETLTEKELLLLVLSYCRYSLRETAAILGVAPVKNNIYMRKLDIRNKLREVGVPEGFIQETLFENGEISESESLETDSSSE